MESPSEFTLVKRGRMDKTQVRDRMLQAATSEIERSGLTVSLDHISFEAVIHAADVPRSAAYRVWPTKEEFFDDLLRHLASERWPGTSALSEEYFDEALRTALEHEDEFVTAEGRRRALHAAARVGIQRDADHLATTSAWRNYVAITATVMSLPSNDDLRKELEYELHESEDQIVSRFADHYRHLSRLVGFRLRPEFHNDYSIMATLGAAIVEGITLRQFVSPAISNRQYVLDAFETGVKESWSLAAFACTAVFDQMFEEDPEYDEGQAKQLSDLARKFLASKER